jgi:hypothetical protein
MQIPPTTALLHVLSSLPAQAAQVIGPAGAPGNASPPQTLDRARQAVPPTQNPGAERDAIVAASRPTSTDATPVRNLPRGSIIDIVV